MVQTSLVVAHQRIASGFLPTEISLVTVSFARSKTTSLFFVPEVAKPRPASFTITTPCAPSTPGTWPTVLPLARSTTSTVVP